MKFEYIKKKEVLYKNKKTGEVTEIQTESIIVDDDAVNVVDKIVNKVTDKFFEKIETNKICDTLKSIFRNKK